MTPALMLFLVAFMGACCGLLTSTPSTLLWGVVVVTGARLATWTTSRWLPLRSLLLLLLGFTSSWAGARHRVELHQAQLAALPVLQEVVVEGVAADVAPARHGRLRVDLDVERWWQGASSTPASGQHLRLSFAASVLLLPVQAGDRIRVRGKVRPLLSSSTPGTFDAALFGLARGQHGRMGVYDAQKVALVERDAQPAVFAHLRNHLRSTLMAQVPEREAGVVLALLVGDTATFDDEQQMLYRKVGAGHLLAVSGLQVTLIAVIVFKVMTWVLAWIPFTGRRNRVRPWAALSSLTAVWSFVALCGAPPSCVRAAAMATAGVVALFLGRRARGVEAFGVAGWFTLMLSPTSVIDPSFLLSYAAVLGLLVAQMHTTPPVDDTWATRMRWRRDQLVALLLSAGAAGALTLPVSAALFGEVSPGGLAANVVLVPAAATLQIPSIFLGLAGALLGLPTLTHYGALAAGWLEALTEGCGDLVGGLVRVEPPVAWQTGLLVVMAVLALRLLLPTTGGRRRKLVALAAGVVVVMAPSVLQPSGLRIHVLPVGQGDGAVFALPGGEVFVVDAGGVWDEHLHPGRDVVVPFLQRKGMDVVDVMVLSHPDPDHLLGLIDVLQSVKVKELWHSGFGNEHPLMKRLLAAARAKNVVIRNARDLVGQHQFGSVRVDVLTPWPEDGGKLYGELSPNNNSLTLRFVYGQTSALWPGDLEFWGETYLLRDHGDISSTVVKAPHHGSRTSSSPAFVAAVQPEHVVFPTGENNQWGFPHAPVVQRWAQTGAQLWDTAVHGEITLTLTGHNVEVQTHRQGQVKVPLLRSAK